LYGTTLDYYEFSVVVRPLLIVLVGTLVFWFLSYWLFRDIQKSALLASFFLLLFFSHGSWFQLLIWAGWSLDARQLSLPELMVYGALGTILACLMVLLQNREANPWTRYMNVFAIILLFAAATSIGWGTLKRGKALSTLPRRNLDFMTATANPSSMPDI